MSGQTLEKYLLFVRYTATIPGWVEGVHGRWAQVPLVIPLMFRQKTRVTTSEAQDPLVGVDP